VVVDLDEADEASLEELREFLLDHPGDLSVRFELVRRGRFRARLVPPPALTVDGSQETRDALQERLGSGWCEFEYDTPIRKPWRPARRGGGAAAGRRDRRRSAGGRELNPSLPLREREPFDSRRLCAARSGQAPPERKRARAPNRAGNP